MALGEFDVIARYFTHPARRAVLGVGDDCALLQSKPGTQMAISCDMLVAGRHFFPDVDPYTLGHKALAVNLSDLAACGAEPLAFTLALALPEVNETWLAAFSRGLFALADSQECELIGGDTTRGPLNICITVFGEVPAQGGHSQALLRSGAQPGDDIYVSGTVGDARLALEAMQSQLAVPAAILDRARVRLELPTPRVALGLALRGVASAAIDISDGLLGDLGHILKASGCGATVDASVAVNLLASGSHSGNAHAGGELHLSHEQQLRYVLAGGDDYELLFTASETMRTAVEAASRASSTPVTRIGRIEPEAGLRLVDALGKPVSGHFASFDHFA